MSAAGVGAPACPLECSSLARLGSMDLGRVEMGEPWFPAWRDDPGCEE
jgi:hypothetical protein